MSACRICGTQATAVGPVRGDHAGRDFRLERCGLCGFAMIADPLDPATVYDAAYYAGEGADPLVDYHFELTHPDRTIRQYEWRGLAALVPTLADGPPGRWLDFGCGNGGLVRHLRATGVDAVGFEEGGVVPEARAAGIPIHDRADLAGLEGTFDVVTAIEVLEHALDPLEELRTIRRLLRPGGLFFATTGNAAPYRADLAGWRYVTPEMHISFFEPGTLAYALERTGFRPRSAAPAPGWDDVYKFKVLKNLRRRRRSAVTDRIPGQPLAKVFDRVLRLTDMPAGIAS